MKKTDLPSLKANDYNRASAWAGASSAVLPVLRCWLTLSCVGFVHAVQSTMSVQYVHWHCPDRCILFLLVSTPAGYYKPSELSSMRIPQPLEEGV